MTICQKEYGYLVMENEEVISNASSLDFSSLDFRTAVTEKCQQELEKMSNASKNFRSASSADIVEYRTVQDIVHYLLALLK